jgi:hypothetical protein
MDNEIKKPKVLITESTKNYVEDELEESLDEMDEQDILNKVNASKVAVAKMNESGEIEIRQSLNG